MNAHPLTYAIGRASKVVGVGLTLFGIYLMGLAHGDQCSALLSLVLRAVQLGD